jgi:hypothetical protein
MVLFQYYFGTKQLLVRRVEDAIVWKLSSLCPGCRGKSKMSAELDKTIRKSDLRFTSDCMVLHQKVDLICVIRKEIRLYALKYKDQNDIPTSVLFPHLVLEYSVCLFIFT